MSVIVDQESGAAATRRSRRVAVRRPWSVANLIVAAVVVVGAGLLAYPSGATWWSDFAHASTVSGYAQAVDGADTPRLETLLDDAHAYNDHLPEGPLRDPYVLNEQGGGDDVESGREVYEQQLALRADAPMARIRIPEIGVDLPVYHGTDEETLARGIGHLYGSALPVGGEGTHAVLTGHSGIPGATLFTRLDELVIGDEFAIDVAGETLVYRVDRIDTVLPDDGDLLRAQKGEDQVTLLTCTPTGVNTHRLLVRGTRVDVETAASDEIALPAASVAPGPPWDAIAILLGGLSVAAVIAWPRRATR